ncbi:MAG: hypothetical protein HQL39_19580 [Alphaproteobacteria bacterium]|nr:hypothetical protein [Alphaproteobacteria bacterium]
MEKLYISLDEGDKARRFDKQDERLQQRSYSDVDEFLKQSLADVSACAQTRAGRATSNEPPRAHDAIFVDGARGTGKTAFLLNIKGAMSSEGFHFCSPIDPTLLEKNETFLNVIIAKLHDEVKRRPERRMGTDYHKALDGVSRAIATISDGETTQPGMDRILSHREGIGLIGSLDTYYAEVCNVLGKNAVVLAIDDIDMSFKDAFGVLDTIRRYLASPLIIPVVTGDFSLYRHLVSERFRRDLSGKRGVQETTFDSAHLAEEYLRKVLPTHRRTSLLTAPQLIEQHEIELRFGLKTAPLSTVLWFLKHLMYRQTNGVEGSHPDFLPQSTRGLVQRGGLRNSDRRTSGFPA